MNVFAISRLRHAMIATASCLLAVCPGTVAHAALTDLNWLAGCWAADDAEAGSVEIWSGAAGHTMLGFGRRIRDGRTVSWEYLRIVEDDAGIRYIASPSGQPTAEFVMSKLDNREVVFENPAHDFPQRITYRRIDRRKLLARIEGSSGGEHRSIDFPMTRCAAAAAR